MRTTIKVAGAVEQTAGRTRAVLVVSIEVEGEGYGPPCDLCAEVGITRPATHEARLPGGTWADLCAAHAYRAKSAKLTVIDHAHAQGDCEERSAA